MKEPLRVIAVMLLLAASPVTGQAPAAFEAATVKPSREATTSWSLGCANRGPIGNIAAGRCQGANVSLMRLIATAYDLPFLTADQYISGGPGWLKNDRFNVDAKAANPSAANAELQLTLRTLLADRFKLKLHEENRNLNGYALVVARGGPKLRPLPKPESLANAKPVRIAFSVSDTAQLAMSLSNRVGAPVVDKTNITGEHDFTVRLESITGDDAPSIFTVIQEEFGLKLESQKVPAKVLVIDYAERPGEN